MTVTAGGNIVTVINGIGIETVVIARQNHHRSLQTLQLFLDEVHRLVGHPIMIEEVASDKHKINLFVKGMIDDGLETTAIQGTMRVSGLGPPKAVAIEMNISGM